jgi:flavin-dependent dehydrogenase
LAKELSNQGFKVTVFEAQDREAFSNRYHWSDAVYYNVLKDAGLPVPVPDGGRWRGYGVKGENSGLDLYESSRSNAHGIFSPDYEVSTDSAVNLPGVLADRQALLNYQTQQTLEAGAEIRFGCKVTGLLGNTRGSLGQISVTGCAVEGPSGTEEIPADLTVDAAGGQPFGVRCFLEPPEIGAPMGEKGCHFVVRSIRKIDDTVHIDPLKPDWEHPPVRHHTRQKSTNGAFWSHTLSENVIDIAAGAGSLENAKAIVDDYMSRVPGIREEVGYARDKFFIGLPVDALTATGFMVVGHSGFQVCPANGCGVSQAYMAALLAAQVIRHAPGFDISSLWEYAHRWMTTIGAHHIAIISHLSNLTPEEVKFLLRMGIMNGEIISLDALEVFPVSKNLDNYELRAAFAQNPGLIVRWLLSDAASRRMLEHYRAYPGAWDPFDWIRWRTFSPATLLAKK